MIHYMKKLAPSQIRVRKELHNKAFYKKKGKTYLDYLNTAREREPQNYNHVNNEGKYIYSN